MTAVEWLVDQMRQRKEQGLTLSFYDLEMFASYAKEMEHEQIIIAYDKGDENGANRIYYHDIRNDVSAEQYYNELNKSE